MDIIRSTQDAAGDGEKIILLTADRATLAKRRWRGAAEDGREFGFDLEHALAEGSVFFREAGKCYKISQAPEPVFEIEFGGDPVQLAIIAWQIGNLHFSIEVTDVVIRCPDDPALEQMLGKEQITWRRALSVFHPLTSSVGHAHHH